MTAEPDHESALLLVLRDGESAAEAFEALLAHPDVCTHHFPPPWVGETAGIELDQAMPALEAITRGNLPDVLDVLLRLHTPDALDRLCRRTWAEIPEQVRQFYLQRPLLGVVGSILRLSPKSAQLEPPTEFVEAQVFLNGFEMHYRIRREDETRPVAPPEEGSLVLYPFDPANAAARREAGLPEGRGPVLEAFAYADARDRHRRVLEDVAHGRGWRVVDTATAKAEPTG